jgi:hypothetical protein
LTYASFCFWELRFENAILPWRPTREHFGAIENGFFSRKGAPNNRVTIFAGIRLSQGEGLPYTVGPSPHADGLLRPIARCTGFADGTARPF